jgi:hypothetical protein
LITSSVSYNEHMIPVHSREGSPTINPALS